jgi:hypothetical protein
MAQHLLSAEILRKELTCVLRDFLGGDLGAIYREISAKQTGLGDIELEWRGHSVVVDERALADPLDLVYERYIRPFALIAYSKTLPPEVLYYWAA